MTENINGVTCTYQRKGASEPAVVFLHGWGGDIRSFGGAYNSVVGWGMSAVNLEFPQDVPSHWGIYDYAEYVKRFFHIQGVREPVIVGHSFGGRVGIILAAQNVCSRLVLVDSAGMRPRPSLAKKIRIAKYRRAVKLNKPLDGMGSVDYNNTQPERRGVFVRIVNTHLDKLLPYIKCKTLIVWGRHDRDTPMYMARRLHKGISDSRLVVIDGGHYSYIDSNYGFLRELRSFITE